MTKKCFDEIFYNYQTISNLIGGISGQTLYSEKYKLQSNKKTLPVIV